MKAVLLLFSLGCAIVQSYATHKAVIIKPDTWKFRGIHPIAYETARLEPTAAATGDNEDVESSSFQRADGADGATKTPVLLLNGFGVGSFHQHRLIEELFAEEKHHRRSVYTMDYLGQGGSWPADCDDGNSENEKGLRSCGSTWVEQILDFIEHVVLRNSTHTKVHLVGNSVGGHLAVFVAAKRPDLIASITLLNATPVWGFNLPGWSGHLPAPFIPKFIGRYLFDRIRDLKTISTFLNNCYANRAAYDERLMHQIRECTIGAGGHAAFASILWSPPVTVDLPNRAEKANFEACLMALQCPTLLAFGRNDPWCTPAFAKRILQQLSQRPAGSIQRYVELSPVGHCPNHEAPKSVARLLTTWWGGDRSNVPLVPGVAVVQEAWGQTVLQERATEEIPVTWAERLAMTLV